MKSYFLFNYYLTYFNYIINTFIYHGYNEFCGKYDSDHYPVVVDLII